MADLPGQRVGQGVRRGAAALPDDVVERTRAKYVEAYERLTGRTFTAG